jgi:hypothetical protein
MSGKGEAEVAFTDRAGAHWIRRATGELEEIAEAPFEYFRQVKPYRYIFLQDHEATPQ